MSTLRSVRFWASILVSGVCLWLAFRAVPLADTGEVLAGGQYLWLIPALLAQLLSIVVRAQRWVILLGRSTRLSDAFWAHGVGYLGTNVLPFRLGEVARVVLMSGRTSQPLARVAASALIERVADVATMLVVLGLVLLWMPVPPLVMQAGLALAGLIAALLIGLVILSRWSELSARWLRWLCRPLPAPLASMIVARWGELASGLVVLSDPRVALGTIVTSLGTWGLSLVMFLCVIRVYVTDGTVLEAAFMMVAIAMSATVPASPGFIGVFQLVGQQALSIPFGEKYSLSSALAVTLAVHLTYYITTTALGVVGLWRLGSTLAHLGSWLPLAGKTPSRIPGD